MKLRFTKYLYIFSVFVFHLSYSFAQSAAKAEVTRKGNVISINSEGKQYRFEVCTPSMIRIRLANNEGFAADEIYMVTRYEWDEIPFSFCKTENSVEIKTAELTAKISTNPVHIAFYSPDNKLINRDVLSSPSMYYTNESPSCMKELQPGEHFFGFGERMDFMDQLGKKLTLNVGRGIGKEHETGAYNILEANYSPVPFFMSTNGYGIFMHNSYPSEWDMGNSSAGNYSFSATGGELDYYFIYGPTFKAIIKQYTLLTGTSPLLPRSAMGLHVGTYSGGTWGHEDITCQYYVVALARKFRELGIPVDILHLDSTWRIFGKVNGKGGTSFEWRQPGFPNPRAMFDSLYALNYQMVGLHIRPRIDNGNITNYLDIAKEKRLTYPENGKPGDFLNYFDQPSVDWWWDNCLKPLADMGCKFVKTDEGSAFGRVGNELVDKMGPQGKEIASLHNLFPIAYAKAPFLKFQEYNNMRGMEHTREGFAGIQRYPFIFAGDWPSHWQYFKPVIRAGLNIGLSGVPAWAHCMGGFEQVADPELYVRWCQFGMFSPIAHLFGMEHPNYKEPWNYGDEAQKIFTQYDKLRYRLIPYIYSTYYQSYQTGTPVIRALVFAFQTDVNTYNIDDQYLFGDNMLICPVTEKGARTRTLYLPEGNWIDYWTGEKFTGKQHIITKTPLEKLPIYLKAGAIIPMQPDMQYYGEKPNDQVILDIYPYQNSTASLFEDDGKSLDYQQGVFALTEIICSEKEQDVTIEILPTKGKYELVDRNYTLLVHLDKRPMSVSSDGLLLTDWEYDTEKKLAEITIVKNSHKNMTIKIVC
jgi:alpha-glucosidase (family GH31 glycosyl hydrolase)